MKFLDCIGCIHRFDYSSGKSIELKIENNLILIKEFKNGKMTKDFFVTMTEIVNRCYRKIK